jgi:hypothetical protein
MTDRSTRLPPPIGHGPATDPARVSWSAALSVGRIVPGVQRRLALLALLAAQAQAGAVGADLDRIEAQALFNLCADNVAAVALVEAASGTAVEVRLAADAAAAFALITRSLRGQRLTVLAGDDILISAIVQAPVASGVIRSPSMTRAEAAALARNVRTRRASSECGVSVLSATPGSDQDAPR